MHLAVQVTLFATNCSNYSWYVLIYILDMLKLPEDVAEEFSNGQLVGQEKSGAFNTLWTYIEVEKTVIRDSKSEGGVIGITRNTAALLHWTLTRHRMGEYSKAIRERAGIGLDKDTTHASTKKSSIKRDEDDCQKMIDYMHTNMANPFDVDKHPIHDVDKHHDVDTMM